MTVHLQAEYSGITNISDTYCANRDARIKTMSQAMMGFGEETM